PDQAQHWIATSRGLPAGDVPVLDERRFGRTHDRPNSVKPFDHGLYTSTAPAGRRSMWRCYLDLYHGSELFPLPWYTYEVGIADRNVRQIRDAHDWAWFLESYPEVRDGIVYPDWRRVANDHAGVHIGLRAVVAV